MRGLPVPGSVLDHQSDDAAQTVPGIGCGSGRDPDDAYLKGVAAGPPPPVLFILSGRIFHVACLKRRYAGPLALRSRSWIGPPVRGNGEIDQRGDVPVEKDYSGAQTNSGPGSREIASARAKSVSRRGHVVSGSP